MKSLYLALALALIPAIAAAAGPPVPAIPKYTSCGARGNVTSIHNQDFPSASFCPLGYEERTVEIFVSLTFGSVAVVLRDGLADPDYSSCIAATGLLVSPCHGDEQPICLITSWEADETCGDSVTLKELPDTMVPPPPWQVGTLVAVHIGDGGTEHVIEFPGAPEGVDCTNSLDPSWCLEMGCGALGTPSTYGCDTSPILSCLAYQVNGSNITRITDINPDACK